MRSKPVFSMVSLMFVARLKTRKRFPQYLVGTVHFHKIASVESAARSG